MTIHAIEEIKDLAVDSRPVLSIRLGRGRDGRLDVSGFSGPEDETKRKDDKGR